MKTSAKILLLLAAIFVCLGIILIYQKTSVSAPIVPKLPNPHEAYLKEQLDSMKNSEFKSPCPDDEFIVFIDLDKRFLSENVIEAEEYDESIKELFGIYLPQFHRWAFSVFGGSNWTSSQIAIMEKRIKDIRGLKSSSGKKDFLSDFVEDNSYLNEIEGVIRNYHAAWKVAGKTTYTDRSEAISNIGEARQYAGDAYLKNNRALAEALRNLPSRLEASHYNQIMNARRIVEQSTYIDSDNILHTDEAARKRLNQLVSDYNSISYPSKRSVY